MLSRYYGDTTLVRGMDENQPAYYNVSKEKYHSERGHDAGEGVYFTSEGEAYKAEYC